MAKTGLVFAAVLLFAAPVWAQTTPAGEVLGRSLPAPDVNEDAPPRLFLLAARQAVAAGRMDEAMEALERAESRALIRSVRPSLAGNPSDQPVVRAIATARAALRDGDRPGALAGIDAALADPGSAPADPG